MKPKKNAPKVGKSVERSRAETTGSGESPAPKAVRTPSKNEHGLTFQQESFAQLVASGRSQADAYRAAYPGSQEWKVEALYVHASEMAAHSKVSVRIKGLRAVIMQQAIEDAVVDKAWVLKRLKIVAERCLQAAPVLNRKGEPVMSETEDGETVPVFDFNAMGAARALELLGKEQSMFVDRKEIGEPGAFDKLDDDELSQAAAEADAIIAAAAGASSNDRKARDRSVDKAPESKA